MALERTSTSSSLVEVLDRVLDKGIVIDAWVRVSLVGVDLITVEARVVVASIATYLQSAALLGMQPAATLTAPKPAQSRRFPRSGATVPANGIGVVRHRLTRRKQLLDRNHDHRLSGHMRRPSAARPGPSLLSSAPWRPNQPT